MQCPNILNFAPSSSKFNWKMIWQKKFSSSPQVFQASFQKLGAPHQIILAPPIPRFTRTSYLRDIRFVIALTIFSILLCTCFVLCMQIALKLQSNFDASKDIWLNDIDFCQIFSYFYNNIKLPLLYKFYSVKLNPKLKGELGTKKVF